MNMKCRIGLLIVAFFFISAIFPFEIFAAESSDFSDLLTDTEKQYVEEMGMINTIVSPNKGPIQYIGADGAQEGITVDVMEEIASLTRLRFTYISMTGMSNIQNAIESGEADIVGGLPKEQTIKEAYRINFSQVYLSCSYGVILNRSNNLANISELILALPTGLDVPTQFEDAKAIKRYDSIQECINAVQNKAADFSYGNAYVLEFYSQGYRLQNLCVIPMTGPQQDICLGISKGADPRLGSILNKAIAYIGDEGLTNILIRNVSVSTQPITLVTFISANPQVSAIVGLLILLAIVFIALLLVGNYRLKSHQIRLEHQRYLLVSEVTLEYFYEYNIKADTVTLSEDAAELFGCKPILHKWSDKVSQSVSSDALGPIDPFNKDFDGASKQEVEVQIPLKDGSSHWFCVSRVPIYEAGKLTHVSGKMRDVQEEHLKRDTLIEKSLCDGLTGLYHASATKRLVDAALENQNSGTFFITDLDYFKNVNDSFGHQIGDEVIKSMADILRKTFRKEDIVGRLGGDEFIVFAPNISDPQLIEIKCRQMQTLVGEIEFPQTHYQTISIGIAQVTAHMTFDQLYHQADEALYAAKENGRNCSRMATRTKI